MQLNKQIKICVQFANFCTQYDLNAGATAELIRLAWNAKWAAEVNGPTPEGRGKHGEKVEKLALALGFKVMWTGAGLWPTLIMNDDEQKIVDLPTLE